ncbi:Secondary metabolism regulator laeA [Zalerion maritima]|uniref:Secondary metabolism regulator laeA n=1 Tax=Zalerion maritima TaxID=339359 RepID=A0AAD5RSL4_9PEZI|nr:Secondary metabolism regulator laeA [Zalerion maritima]
MASNDPQDSPVAGDSPEEQQQQQQQQQEEEEEEEEEEEKKTKKESQDESPLSSPVMTSDPSEPGRLALQQTLFQQILNGKLMATQIPPPPKTSKPAVDPNVISSGGSIYQVLDLGCGSAKWCAALAAARPDIAITGVDMSRVLLPARAPPNVALEVEDVRKTPWSRGERSVDFVHVRDMGAAIGGRKGWKKVLGETWRVLKPGGLVEVAEIRPRWWDWKNHVEGSEESDDSQVSEMEGEDWLEKETPDYKVGLAVAKFEKLFHGLGKRAGIDFDSAPKVPEILRDAGFVKVVERTEVLPIGGWAKDEKLRVKGELYLEMLDHGSFENYSMKVFTQAGWKEEDVRNLIDKTSRDFHNPELQGYSTAVFITAKKPSRAA